MRKFTFTLFAMLWACLMTAAQDASTPIFTGVGYTVVEDEDYGESYFPAVDNVGVEVYADHILLKGWSGVAGRDMKVYFDSDENLTELIPVVDGVDQEPISSAAYIYTGLSDLKYIYAYVSGYSYAWADETSGYVYISAYVNNDYGYYWCVWGDEEVDPDADALYTAMGQVTETEGWGTTPMPELNDIKVAGYEDYIIIRGFAGVSGYDLKVGLGANDAVTGVTPIIEGVESETVTSGYLNAQTGLEDYPVINMYVGARYCYVSSDASAESGYFLIYARFGDTDGYYYIYWPQDDEQGEWTNPFEQEATFLYTCKGETSTDEDSETIFPVIKDIVVDVYDTYIYIRNIAGVDGYGAKLAYNADEDVTSIIAVQDGVDSDPCKDYIYLYTGLEAYPTIQAYTKGYSFAGLDEDGDAGYVMLGAYIYDAANKYEWSYYYLSWSKSDNDGIVTVRVDKVDKQAFNILGQPVSKDYKGFIIVDGKKYLNN